MDMETHIPIECCLSSEQQACDGPGAMRVCMSKNFLQFSFHILAMTQGSCKQLCTCCSSEMLAVLLSLSQRAHKCPTSYLYASGSSPQDACLDPAIGTECRYCGQLTAPAMLGQQAQSVQSSYCAGEVVARCQAARVQWGVSWHRAQTMPSSVCRPAMASSPWHSVLGPSCAMVPSCWQLALAQVS